MRKKKTEKKNEEIINSDIFEHTDSLGIDAIEILTKHLNKEMMSNLEKLVPLNEPYQFKEEGCELIKDIPSKPIKVEYFIKNENDFSGVREDYITLIKEIRKAKNRNEIICLEIEAKNNHFNQSINSSKFVKTP